MPVTDESRTFRSLDLHDDADSYGIQESGDYGTMPADQKRSDDIRDDFGGRPDAMRIVYYSNEHHLLGLIFSLEIT